MVAFWCVVNSRRACPVLIWGLFWFRLVPLVRFHEEFALLSSSAVLGVGVCGSMTLVLYPLCCR